MSTPEVPNKFEIVGKSADTIIFDDEDTDALSLSEIYNTVLAHNEVIITIPQEQEQALRSGLASVKAKQNKKLKDSGISPDISTLSYVITPSKKKIEGAIDVHITLSKKGVITVLDMQLPDDKI